MKFSYIFTREFNWKKDILIWFKDNKKNKRSMWECQTFRKRENDALYKIVETRVVKNKKAWYILMRRCFAKKQKAYEIIK